MKKIYLTTFALMAMTGAMAQNPRISSSEQPVIMRSASSMTPISASATLSEAKALADNEMYVSYSLDPSPFLRLGTVTPYEVATYFDNMLIEKYVGDKVTKLRVAVGSKPAALTIWLREKLSAEPIFSQEIAEADLPEEGWVEVELPADKVYTIKKDGYYVGFTMTEKKVSSSNDTYYPLAGSLDGSLLQNTFLISQDGGENWIDLTTNYASQNIILTLGAQTAIASDKHADCDLSLHNFHGDFSFIKRDAGSNKATIAFNGYVFNAGKEPITSLDLTVTPDGVEPVTTTVNIDNKKGLTMFKGSMFRGSIEVPNDVASLKINLKASNLNEGANVDEYAANDETSTEDIHFYDVDTVKTSLVEMYTTDKCINCPYGHKVIEALPESCNKVLVAHHVGYYEDMYTIDESKKYMDAFGVSGAPSATTDRTYILDEFGTSFSTGYTNPTQGANFVNENITFSQKVLPAFASITATSTYNESSREVTVKVHGRKVNQELFDKAMTEPRLNVFITEDKLVSNQTGGGSNYVHNHVLRAVLGEIWGKEATWSGDNYTAEFKTTINAGWNPDNMSVVAVLTNEDADSRYFHNAMNAAQTDLKENIAIAIEKNIMDDLSIEVTDGTIYINGDYNAYQVYNMQGLQVENSHLEKGIYLVKVQTGNKSEVHKIIID